MLLAGEAVVEEALAAVLVVEAVVPKRRDKDRIIVG